MKKLIDLVESSTEVAEKYHQIIASHGEKSDREKAMEEISKLAASAGFQISVEELNQLAETHHHHSREISEEELDSVSGGVVGDVDPNERPCHYRKLWLLGQVDTSNVTKVSNSPYEDPELQFRNWCSDQGKLWCNWLLCRCHGGWCEAGWHLCFEGGQPHFGDQHK